jgi:membrane-associated protease RseP (regulator of RpoE activity)
MDELQFEPREIPPTGELFRTVPIEWRPPVRRAPAWRTYAIHLGLLALTAVTIYTNGGPRLVIGVLSILVSHEMGHYLACRYYGVDATLPYVLPGPPFVSLVGTFGALIRIRGHIPNRRALFDIGIAGPLAGFLACLPVLALGVLELQPVRTVPSSSGIFLGEPLLFRVAVQWLRGPLPDDMTWDAGPFATSAWFGLLVTALNLMPIGQLDGGHVTYALLRRRAAFVSRAGLACCLVLLYLRPMWIAWSVLVLVVGRRGHPPTLDDRLPIGVGRVVVAVLGLIVFVLCFTPSPVVLSWPQFLQLTGLVRS